MNLGDKVNIRAYLVPVKKSVYYNGRTSNDLKREYTRVETNKNGIIVGKRVLREGISEYEYEAGYFFRHTKSIPVYLVAINMRQIYKVLEEDIHG